MRINALVIRKQPTGEYDQLITCYAKELGKLTAVARSSLKSNSIQGQQLDVLNLVSFELVSGKYWPIITGAQCEKAFPVIKSSLPALAMSYFFLEAISKIVFDHQPDEKLWNFLADILEELDQNRISSAQFMERQKNLLDILGYGADGQLAGYDNMPIDLVFENLAARRFKSLDFLYSILY
jgi:DNA repair protein RecO